MPKNEKAASEKPRLDDIIFYAYCQGRQVFCEYLDGQAVEGIF